MLREASELSDRAFRALTVLKVELGPAGIERRHGLHELLSDYMTLTAADTEAALSELEQCGALRREGSLAWLVGQLAHNPYLHVTNGNHRKLIQRHVAKLPPSPLLTEWKAAHAEWLVSKPDSIPDTIPDQREERREKPVATTPPRLTLMPSESVSDIRSWLAPALAVLASGHRPRTLTPELETVSCELRNAGVLPEELATAASAMLREANLERAGLKMLLKDFGRWRANSTVVDAGARWKLYNDEGLTRSRSDYEESLERLVARGVWPSVEAAKEELSRVRPWDISRTARDNATAVRTVAERLRVA